jgi:cytochrome P450
MDLFSDDMRRNPFPVYERLRGGPRIVRMPASHVWMILDYDGVKRALYDHEVFSSGAAPGGGAPLDWLIFADPPRHTKLRGLIMRAFTPRVVAGLEPRIRELSRGLLDQMIERREMDLVADFAVPLPMMVIAEMLGIPLGDRPRFKRWSDVILNLSETVSGTTEEASRAAMDFGAVKVEMGAYLTCLLAERRRAPKEDLLSKLVDAEVDGERLTGDEILGFFQLLLLAGTETTTNLISNAVLCFVEHPGELARLKAAPELLPSAIEEILRYRSPLQAMFRQTKRDVEMDGQTIPADKLVLTMIGSANRDPRQFPDAERFDVARDPNPHLAFGHGVHFCVGAPLARLEARIALGDILERLRGFRLADERPWEPRKAFHIHGPTRLPIRFERARRSVASA